jgi:hypothetical protein
VCLPVLVEVRRRGIDSEGEDRAGLRPSAYSLAAFCAVESIPILITVALTSSTVKLKVSGL